MKREKISFEKYWASIGQLFDSQDTVECVDGEDEWNGDLIVEYRDSCGCLLSRYNRDKGIAEFC